MTQTQFLEATKGISAADVRRAINRVLSGGPRPQSQSELLRFRLMVWLELQGRLRPTA